MKSGAEFFGVVFEVIWVPAIIFAIAIQISVRFDLDILAEIAFYLIPVYWLLLTWNSIWFQVYRWDIEEWLESKFK